MIKKVFSRKGKKLLWFLAFFSVLFFFPGVSFGAEGDVLWSREVNDYERFGPLAGKEIAVGAASDSAGDVYVAGVQVGPAPLLGGTPRRDWRVEKRRGDTGDLLWEQVLTPTIFDPDDGAMAVAIGPGQERVYVGGQRNGKWRLEERNSADGSLGRWVIEQDVGMQNGVGSAFSSFDKVYDLAIDSTHIYAVGAQDNTTSVSDSTWRIEKISFSGSVVWQKEGPNLSGKSLLANGVALDSTGLYVVGQQEGNWLIAKRDLYDGSETWTAPLLTEGAAMEVAIDSEALYVAGGSNGLWRIEKRRLITNGSIITAVTGQAGAAFDIVLDPLGSFLYIVGEQNGSWWVNKIKRSDFSTESPWPKIISNGLSYRAAAHSSGLYVVGTRQDKDIWRVEKREVLQLPSFTDCGLRVRNGTETIAFACEPAGILTSPLRIRNGGTTYGVMLVETAHQMASPVRIRIGSQTKALRRF